MRNWRTHCSTHWLFHASDSAFWPFGTHTIWLIHRFQISTHCTRGWDWSPWAYSFCNLCLDFSRKLIARCIAMDFDLPVFRFWYRLLSFRTDFWFACAARTPPMDAVARWFRSMRASDWPHSCWPLQPASVVSRKRPSGLLGKRFSPFFGSTNLAPVLIARKRPETEFGVCFCICSDKYSKFEEEGIIVNAIGCTLVALAVLVSFAVRRSNAPTTAKVYVTESL